MSNIDRLTLVDIASWAIEDLATPNIICGLPSLQRGAVWKADQVELLWDSMMRGFPIGSLVISEKIEGQKTKNLKSSTKENTDNVNYHLLDGQQRATAISLGFIDPSVNKENHFSYLWFDLAYDRSKYKNSTRKFLFRVVTPAHPWGYQRNDNTSRLETYKIRNHLSKFENDEKTKPMAYESYPHDAKEPIPFVWLYQAYCENINIDDYWKIIEIKINENKEILPNIEYEEYVKHKLIIFNAIKQIFNTLIPLLEVPKSAYEGEYNKSNISDIEHLFQRLNQQGTKLEGLELSYSMIKAHWSGIENSFEQIKTRPMANAYLAMLGMRASLIDNRSIKLPLEKSITQIRALANNESEKKDKDKIEDYLGINSTLNFNFKKDVDFLEKTLLYNNDNNNFGLPPVLRTHIAQKSRDVYLLLIWIAKYIRENKKEYLINNSFKKRIIGLATSLDWFGEDKKRAVDKIYSILKDDPSDIKKYDNILGQLGNIHKGNDGIKKLVSPMKLKELLKISGEDDLKKWDFWWQIISKHPEVEQEKIRKDIWPFVQTITNGRLNGNNKALLLLMYAQRIYIKKQFGQYDSMLEMWSEQNRPWDYDHILPSSTLYNKKVPIVYRKPGNEYLNSIGNLQILAFEDNRSKNDKKIDCNSIDLDTILIEDNECENYIRETSDFNDDVKTKDFMDTSKNRMIRIYKKWWDDLEIEKLYLT